MSTVPNKFPTIPIAKKIALVGEAPGVDEEAQGEPFVGMSGRFLSALLSQAGVSRDSCFLGNVSQVRPPANDISKWEWQNENIQNGLCQLKKDLAKFEPNIVVLLGNVPLKAAKDGERNHLLKPSLYRFKNGNWRGSLFLSTSLTDTLQDITMQTKCLATLHPAYVLRSYEDAPLLQFDLLRAVAEADTPLLVLPKRTLTTDLTHHEIIWRLANIRELRTPVAIDIEGGVGTLSCISFATNPQRAFIVPFTRKDGSSYWGVNEEIQIWRALAQTLEDPNVPKILQNSLYDRFVLHYSYGIRVQGVGDDTMLKHWSLYAELPKALGVQTSIYTKEPYYKGERKSDGDKEFYEYCCKDSAVTLEINQALERYVKQPALDHYRLNVALLNPLLYMELRGILYDTHSAKARRSLLQHRLYEAQAKLNAICGFGFAWTKGIGEIKNQVRSLMCYKKDGTTPKKDKEDDYERVNELLNLKAPSLATIGEIETLCDVGMNVGSPMFRTFLYEHLQLPPQYKENERREQVLSADYEALLRLSKTLSSSAPNDGARLIVALAIEIRALATRERMLSIHADRDGRIRCGYNIVGSDTGRITCYTSPTGSGYNLQTIPNYTDVATAPGGVLGDRDLFIADEGHWFAQMDLEGADGWTVAAYSAMLGDTTMIDDYRAGLKPAQVLAIKQCGYEADFQDRASLREAKKRVKKDSWEYFACKRVHHGCLTAGHEVLTKNGWVDISKVSDDVEIMVCDLKNKTSHFEKPSQWLVKPYSGELYEMNGTAFSIQCTDHHKFFVDDNGEKEFPAYVVHKKKSGRLPYTTRFIQNEFSPPGRLIAAIHADGCFHNNNVQFHFKKDRKVERIQELLKDKEKQVYFNQDGTVTITTPLTEELLACKKKPGAHMLTWSQNSLAAYVDEIKFWDASQSERGTVVFCSVEKETVAWIQTLSQLCGKGTVYQGTYISGFGSEMHRCTQNNRGYAWINSMERSMTNVENVPVFCPTVSTGYFLYRRNNKIAISGNSDYLEGKITISRNILKDSEGKLYLTPSECEQLKTFFFQRYWGVKRWHNWVAGQLRNSRGTPTLTAASGQVRKFFGRRDDILTKAVAFEPQANTTYATNLAMYKLWTDTENCLFALRNAANDGDLRLRIEPLHQVHDALCVQFAKADTVWAVGKIKQWFNNPLQIAGQRIIIPFEGHYGRAWGDLNEGSI